MASAVDPADGPITAINVTPLVDIILVVLIIFMATAPLIQRRVLKVDVPKSSQHERAATEAVQVAYNAKRELSLGGKTMSQEELSARLRAATARDPELHVTFSADKVLPYGDIVGVLDALRAAGVKRIGLEVVRK